MKDGRDAEGHDFYQRIDRAIGPLEAQSVQQFVKNFRCDEVQYRRKRFVWNTIEEKKYIFLPAKK